MRFFFFIIEIFKKYKFYLLINIVALSLLALTDIAAVISLIAVVDLFLQQNSQVISPITEKIMAMMVNLGLPTTLFSVVVIFLSFSVLRSALQILVQYSIFKTKYAVCYNLSIDTIKDFLNTSWYFFSSGRQGTLLNTFNREMTVVGDAFGSIARYFSIIIQIGVFLFIPFYLSWQITAIVLILAFGFALPFFLLGKLSYRLGKKNTSTGNEFNKVVHECLNSAKIILGFANQDKTIKDLKRTYHNHTQATIKSQTLNAAIPISYYPIGLLVMIIGLFLSRKISLPISEAAVLFYSIARAIPLFGQIAGQKNSLDNFFPSYEQINQLRTRAQNIKQPSGSKMFLGFNNKISIINLSFAYPNHDSVLNNINMVIPKGRMVAIVGGSGIGKSTLLDMLMRFYEPTRGNIMIDSVDLKEFDVNSYRRRIGYVPQDSILFNASIRDNLIWANDKANEDEIINVCQQANAREFIEKFPDGYETAVGDRGVRLSGGQIQRIALARAILRKPELLILDEATSALDTYSERLIQQAVENIAQNTTVVVVAHRLSTIKNAHYIYLLGNGQVIEEGTYSDLISKDGAFSHMVNLQTLGREK